MRLHRNAEYLWLVCADCDEAFKAAKEKGYWQVFEQHIASFLTLHDGCDIHLTLANDNPTSTGRATAPSRSRPHPATGGTEQSGKPTRQAEGCSARDADSRKSRPAEAARTQAHASGPTRDEPSPAGTTSQGT